jgi:hypothetical protein
MHFSGSTSERACVEQIAPQNYQVHEQVMSKNVPTCLRNCPRSIERALECIVVGNDIEVHEHNVQQLCTGTVDNFLGVVGLGMAAAGA